MVLTKEENELLTRVGPGTPAGELIRRYWQPAALSEELPLGGAPLPVRLLGEDLVLFRDDQGRPGLLGLHCSHRGADLSYGRVEDGGLRCIYHGWLYDVHGRCLEQPGEPSNSWTYSGGRDSMQSSTFEAQTGARSRPFHGKIRHTAYPCQERAGIIFAYLGPGEPPLLPNYEFLTIPDEYRTVTKYFQDDNYLQGNEGNVDPQHLSFLHRIFSRERGGDPYGYHSRDVSPQIETEETGFGMRIYAIRRVSADQLYVKIREFMLPNMCGVAGIGIDGYSVNWHVPIDDEHHWRYGITFRRDRPLSADDVRRNNAEVLPGYRLARNRANRYLQDREEMKTGTFLGVGTSFVVHDTAATEGEGPIFDRTQEHLGYTDRGVIKMRQIMFAAIKDVMEGRDPPHVIRDAAANHFEDIVVRDDAVPAEVDWRRLGAAAIRPARLDA